MEQVKFLRLVCLIALNDSAFMEGTFLQRCKACTLKNAFKLCLLLWSNSYENKRRYTEWISAITHCACTLQKKLAVVSGLSILNIVKISLFLYGYRHPSATLFSSTVISALIIIEITAH